MKNEKNLPAPANGEENSLFGQIKEQAFMGFIEGILPQLEPFIKPAENKLEEYFGDDTKIFVMRRRPGKPIQVIVFDNTKGSYEISNEIDEETGERKKLFVATPESIIATVDCSEFITKLLGGEFTQNK